MEADLKRTILFAICCGLVLWFHLALLIPTATAQQAPLLRIGTMDLPPYGWQDQQGVKHGIIYEMNQEIGLRSGMRFSNEIYPFKRMLLMLENGELDLISSQAHQPALDAGDKLTVQFNINVIAGTHKGSAIRSIADLKNSFLVYHHAATYPQLAGLPLKIQRVKSYRQGLQLLYLRDNVDGAIFSEPAYYYWMQDLGLSPDDFGNVVLIEQAKEQWIFVRKDLPAHLRTSLKHITETIYHENLYDRLLLKYGKRE